MPRDSWTEKILEDTDEMAEDDHDTFKVTPAEVNDNDNVTQVKVNDGLNNHANRSTIKENGFDKNFAPNKTPSGDIRMTYKKSVENVEEVKSAVAGGVRHGHRIDLKGPHELSRFPWLKVSIIIVLSVIICVVAFNLNSRLGAIQKILRGNSSQITNLEKTLMELMKRSTHNDYRDPLLLCPGTQHRDYTLVGPPGNWTKCYHFDKRNGEKSQPEAAKFCRSIQGSLVKIRDSAEWDFLAYKLSLAFTSVWLGAKQSDPPTDGRWYWTPNNDEVEEGEEEEEEEENEYFSGRISSGENAVNESEREIKAEANWRKGVSFENPCAYIQNGRWSTKTCGSLFHFICEAPTQGAGSPVRRPSAKSIQMESAICPTNQSCYSLSKQSAGWRSAREKCLSIGADLVKIDGPSENAFLLSYGAEELWLGGFRHFLTGVWRWNDEDDILRENETTFTDFTSDALLKIRASQTGLYRGDDGYYYKFHEMKKGWNEAQNICRCDGGNLAIIFDIKTRNTVRGFMEEGWIGSSDQWQEGSFETPLRGSIPYSSWAPGEPNNQGGEDCTMQHSNKLWNDLSCASQQPFICQFNSGLLNTEEEKKCFSEDLSHCLMLKKTNFKKNNLPEPHHWSIDGCFEWKKFVCEFPPVDEADDGKGGKNESSAAIDNFISRVCAYEGSEIDESLKTNHSSYCYSFVQSQLGQNEAEQFCLKQLNSSLANFPALQKDESSLLGNMSEYLKAGTWRTLPFKPYSPTLDPGLKFRNASGGEMPHGDGYVYYRGDPVCQTRYTNKRWANVVCRDIGLTEPDSFSMDNSIPFSETETRYVVLLCSAGGRRMSDCSAQRGFFPRSYGRHRRGCKKVWLSCGRENHNGFMIDKKVSFEPKMINGPSWFVCQNETDMIGSGTNRSCHSEWHKLC